MCEHGGRNSSGSLVAEIVILQLQVGTVRFVEGACEEQEIQMSHACNSHESPFKCHRTLS